MIEEADQMHIIVVIDVINSFHLETENSSSKTKEENHI